MTLRQHSILRGTTTLEIKAESLQFSFSSFTRDYRFEVPLTDLRSSLDEYRRVAWPWYLVGIVSLGFVVSQLRLGFQHYNEVDTTFLVGYTLLIFYALSVARARSGRFLIVRSENGERRTIWILRQIPSTQVVDAFVEELQRAIRIAKESNQPPQTRTTSGPV